jgi:outer membrane protein TolC
MHELIDALKKLGAHRVQRISTLLFVLACVATTALARAEGEVLTLARAIEMAQRRAPSLRGARAQADSEAAQADVARAPYYPSLTASVTGSANATRDTQPAPPPVDLFAYVTYYAAGSGALSARWTLYDFGKTSNNVTNADAQYDAATANVSATELSVASDAASAYVNLAYNERLRDVARATLTQREKLAVIAKGLVKAGLQPPVEEMRSQARVEAAERDLASAEGNVVDARAVLAAVLGLNPASSVRVTVPRLQRLDMDALAATRAAERLPAVVAARASLAAKRAAISAAQSRYLPTLSFNLDGSYRFTRYDKGDVIANTRTGTAALVLSGPLFDASISPGVSVTEADAVNAESNLDQARRDAAKEAARAALGAKSAGVMLEHARKAAESAAAVLAVVQGRYVQGLSIPLELIDAETSDSDARVAATQAELAYAQSIVRLLTATGRRIEETP